MIKALMKMGESSYSILSYKLFEYAILKIENSLNIRVLNVLLAFQQTHFTWEGPN